jgi:hypothetical protein
MFAVEHSHDPLLAHSDRLIRVGGVVAPVGLCLIAITSKLLHPSKALFDVAMLTLLGIGQVLVWRGLHGVNRTGGWRSGVVAYVWTGAVLTGWAVAFTGHFLVLVVPLIAPVVATLARWRMAREKEPTA